jgi:uncharacterized protein RhaS with RHS repeats
MGVRSEEPEEGRFLSVDPLWERYPGLSPYHYGANNPILNIDPCGLTHGPAKDPERIDNPLDDTGGGELLGGGGTIEPGAAIEQIGERIGLIESAEQAAIRAQNESVANRSAAAHDQMERNSRPQYVPTDANGKPLELPRESNGDLKPESVYPHTQIGETEGRKGSYKQTLEWDSGKRPKQRVDWTDHGRPSDHTDPHAHPAVPNPPYESPTYVGGSFKWGSATPLSGPGPM